MLITIYGPKKGQCPYTDKARNILKIKNIKNNDYNIHLSRLEEYANVLKRKKLIKNSTRVTAPIIFIGSQHLPGGSSDLEKMF